MVNIARILIAAPTSGSGKTTISVGIMAALSRRMVVQPFKVGPDFIDPMYHAAATGRVSRNLDTWMMSLDSVQRSFVNSSLDAGVAVVEGVMGLYDGIDALSERGSTAELAKLLDIPVILVVDAGGVARSAAAVVQGFRDYDRRVNLAGVICNYVASEKHAVWLKQAIEGMGVPVLGCIPRDAALRLPERHLGLITVQGRGGETKALIDAAAELITCHVQLESLLDISRQASAMTEITAERQTAIPPNLRIAIAKDEAFCFYYEDNLDALRRAGAHIVPFSPLHDSKLSRDISGIYFGGGYPELYAEQLAKNEEMTSAIRRAARADMPIYGECGGYLYLAETFTDMAGTTFAGLGLLPGNSRMQSRLSLGYRWVRAQRDTLLLRKGEEGRGHEFHYSAFFDEVQGNEAFFAGSVSDKDGKPFGYARNNLLASYIHLHFDSNEKMAANFVAACREWQNSQRIG